MRKRKREIPVLTARTGAACTPLITDKSKADKKYVVDTDKKKSEK